MKKLFVIAALVMLVPFAYAEEANASASVSAEASAESSAADVQVGITSSGQGGNKYRDRVLKESRDRAKAREDVVARVAVKKEVVKAVKNETNEVRKEVKEAVKETRAQMKDAVKELKECKNKRTKDCEAKRVEGRLDARQSILKSADATLQLLTAAKARASAVSVDAGLDAQIKLVTELKAKAESMNESKGSDIKDLAKQLRDVVKDARNGVQGSMHLVATKRSEGVLRKISELQVKLQRALDKSSEKVDLSALNAKLEEAKKLNAEAMAAFEAARSAEPGKKDEAMKATTEKVREVQRALKEAHVLLKDVVQKLKSARAGTEVLANVSAS